MLRKILFLLLLSLIALTVINIFVSSDRDISHSLNNIEEATNKHSIIALYYCADTSFNDIFIQKMIIQDKYKYIYYSPTCYSEEYFISVDVIKQIINRDSAVSDYFVISDHKDTIMRYYDNNNYGLNGLKYIPEEVSIENNMQHVASYKRKKVYTENIDRKYPFWAKLCFGPIQGL